MLSKVLLTAWGGGHSETKSRISKTGRRFAECTAIRLGEREPGSNFDVESVNFSDKWLPYISRIVKLHKLREVLALQGLRRDTMGDPDNENTRFAPISSNPQPWLPAVELRGEGIFVELNLSQLHKWECKSSVTERMELLESNFNTYAEREDFENKQCPTPRFILLHTLAHMLIRQLTLECGYSSASLKERIYVATPDEVDENPGLGGEMAGCLIYTSTPDSDGSYGGLVRMANSDRFSPMLMEALRMGTWCSSDPICSDADGQGYMGLNRAACHACALVPETSCDYRNLYLDRALAVSPVGRNSSVSFFDSKIFSS